LLLESELRSHEQAVDRYAAQQRRKVALESLDAGHGESLALLAVEIATERAALESAVAALPNDLDERRGERDALEAALSSAETAVREAGSSQAGTAQELETCRVQLARREAALELALEEMADFPDGLEPLDTPERSARSRLRSVCAELEELGAVNHRARNDFEEARERHDSLAQDMRDAESAVAELEGVLGDLDAETSDRYEQAIGQLQLAFARHVVELFGADAKGSIEVEHLDGRHHGLKIHLTPPGKRTQALGLLSVGERTMGALAFLFALMADGDGLPIAVLDEVDAPLDEANIRRYCSFLERLATRGTQFVLVTHQKATFEVADVLWGITTERGVSRVFSIRKEEGAL
jgi:chromosome segregation protein